MGSNIQEQLEIFLNTAVQKKDEEIKNLKEQNDKLREENERLLKQIGGISGDIKHKAENLKKALDDFLEHPNSNRSTYQRYQHTPPNFLPVSIPNSVDVKPSTSTRTDEPSVNGAKYHSNRVNYNSSHEDFSSRQEFRTETDAEIVTQANPTYHTSHSHSQTTLPTPYNGNSQKRFNPNANGFSMNGANNNNNNRNNRNNNNNNNSNKHTIFVSWPGSSTKEQLQELFETHDIDVSDIRYTAQKQFAHVDLKSESAVSKAILLNGTTKNEKQGQLRVELGKPRSSNPNPTENGQRPQNQNKNFNRQNNKNSNGYNTNPPQKLSKYNPYNNNYHNNNNNHHVGLTFGATDDKENNNGWPSSNNDIPNKSES